MYYLKKYFVSHRALLNEYQRRYRIKKRDKISEYQRKWYLQKKKEKERGREKTISPIIRP